MNQPLNRRHFLQQAGAAAASLALFPSLTRRVAPSDKVRVAHIGVNGMGTNHLNWFAKLPEVDIVGLCDVDETHLAKALDTLKKHEPYANRPADAVKTYADFRHILDRKDIDAITCATPDHWHAQIAIMAFQAGKDVYGEKPLSYTVREGQQMLKAQKRYDRIFQLGTQIHAGDNYHRVVEIIRSGVIGKVHTARVWKTGPPPVLGPANYSEPPKTLNWDMWQGPAPLSKYTPERCHFSYRYFMDYSGGVFADFWSHIADVVWWAVEPTGLRTVRSRGALGEGIGDTPKWIDVDYEFDNLKLFWTSTPPNVPGAEKRHIGAYFEGDKGTLICDYNTREITINGVTMNDVAEIPITLERSPGHQQNFIDAVKSRKQPESNLAYARQMTLPMHLGLIAWRLGETLEWNPRKEKFRHNSEANSLLSREYRKGWDLI
ncbi:MAG: gfo/Idh/MocA family oxidoreductase [Cytophagales bacterium]|nr:MAG: gfo/Idh/MocA family oxidoreductase [Cytophagales bacterium]